MRKHKKTRYSAEYRVFQATDGQDISPPRYQFIAASNSLVRDDILPLGRTGGVNRLT